MKEKRVLDFGYKNYLVPCDIEAAPILALLSRCRPCDYEGNPTSGKMEFSYTVTIEPDPELASGVSVDLMKSDDEDF